PADVHQPALDARSAVAVVETGAATNHGEVGLTALGHSGRVLHQLGVQVGQIELAAVDAAVRVAPLGERDRDVPHLLGEPGPDRRALVADGADADRRGGHAL